ncbi:hypothetical protein DW771_14795 [Bacteroides uniformis]|uniref:Uncharacterized protein n=2 Tax=Parabacteroides merdae TaxID=46503 RepID=A0A414C931_9BACT|nr:hypothetical protein DW828_01960 [Parabacteroides merdae]RHE02002.1 hypothetical protein DW771_14795 [Bacteroides uniformis]
MSVSLILKSFFHQNNPLLKFTLFIMWLHVSKPARFMWLYILLDKNTPLRFNLLGKLIPDISTKVLSIYFMDIENLPSHSLQFFLMIQRKILKTTPKRMLNKIQTDF